jgi:hypothetical protein
MILDAGNVMIDARYWMLVIKELMVQGIWLKAYGARRSVRGSGKKN